MYVFFIIQEILFVVNKFYVCQYFYNITAVAIDYVVYTYLLLFNKSAIMKIIL